MTENPTPDDCRRMSTRLAHAFNGGGKTDSPQEVKDAIEMLAWAGAKIERLEAEVARLKGPKGVGINGSDRRALTRYLRQRRKG